MTRKQIDQACGCQMSGHWFDRSQWSFTSQAHYRTMDCLFGGTLKPYEQLKAEYKAIKQKTRHFAVTKHVPLYQRLGLQAGAMVSGQTSLR
ncbi:hypothetical protein [Methylomicrobium lacus]|uniref:hypothetical protein n=1 Tax=Methylomicrobium lacus TaxID=136992 RepID=UPI001268D5BC|nr:hypothetical protein [Methylomicrobium lacus]